MSSDGFGSAAYSVSAGPSYIDMESTRRPPLGRSNPNKEYVWRTLLRHHPLPKPGAKYLSLLMSALA